MKSKRLLSLLTAASVAASSFAALAVAAYADAETVLLDQPMDSEEAVAAVIDEGGYEAMIAENNGTPASIELSYVNAGGQYPCLNMSDKNKWYTSAGLKYDITELVAGKEGSLTITADLSAGYNTVTGAKIGFMSDSGSKVSCESTAIESGAFGTVTYTADSVPAYDERLYFFATTEQPTLRIRNLKLTLVTNEEEPPVGETESPAEETEQPAEETESPAEETEQPTTKPTIKPVVPGYGDFVIADRSGAAEVYIDANGADYDGISMIAEAFANDISLVSGQAPAIKTDAAELAKDNVIIAGTVNDANIKALTAAGKLDVSEIENKTEVYKIQLVDEPMEGVSKAIVIAGSDKRGTIFGIFHISEAIGVSPWVYWGDALPEQRDDVELTAEEINVTSKEPSVRFRGIFINDESPNLTGWAKQQFGQLNHTFYQNVFELVLRLKGNYMWPAMWNNDFSLDGIRGLSSADAEGFDSLENARLADKYGVIMGTSHHEPLCRSGNEWSQVWKSYMDASYPGHGQSSGGSCWNYFEYPNAIRNFWEDGFSRNKDFENVVTVGMRGEADTSLEGGLADNVQNLVNVITDQKEILKKYGKENEPTMLALYKEVEEYWYGGEENGEVVKGLRDYDVADDAIIMLCDDNFGNLRAVPQEDERDREGGWGLYYHFDYHGAPKDYRWVSSTPLEKIWENLTRAYEYKMDDLWIVNVGDIKPHELEIDYFLDLAYDYDSLKDENKIEEYTREWTAQQFGHSGVSDEIINDIADVQLDYLNLNGTKRPEAVMNTTYSAADANEVYRYIDRCNKLYDKAWEIMDKLPERVQDAYYQMVLYQAAGSANVNLMNLYSALNSMYSAEGSVLANKYAELVKECIARDDYMLEYYNKTMSGGKWDGMMNGTDIAHICCTSWDLKSWSYPSALYVSPTADAKLIVNADGTKKGAKTGEISLPTFTSTNKEAYAITVSNGGKNKFSYTAEASDNWIKLSKTSGTIYSGDTIAVTVDWGKLSESKTGAIKITGAGETVTVNVKAELVDVSGLADKTFVAKDGVIAIEAEHYCDAQGNWITINNYGRTLSTVKTKPFNVEYTTDNAPYTEYAVRADKSGKYTLTVYATPSNPITTSGDVRYGVSVDGGAVSEYSSLPEGFLAGDHMSKWGTGVMDNIHTASSELELSEGVHKIRIYQLSSGFSLQKLALTAEGASVGGAYTGPEESWYVGAPTAQKELVHYTVDDAAVIPGVIGESNIKVIVSADGDYTITAPEGTEISLDGAKLDTIANPDGTMEASLAQGEYTIAFTGSGPVEFEQASNTPGVIIDHPMSTEAEFSSAAAGYINRVDGNDDKRVVGYSNGAMKYETTGLYTSSGFKYDITARVKKAAEAYGADTPFTVTMDIKGSAGSKTAMGFMAGGSVKESTPLDEVINNKDFTTVSCTTTFDKLEDIYFYVYTGNPTVYVKNISVTYPAPQEIKLFDHNKSGDWNDYEVYNSEDTDASISKGDSMNVSHGSSYSTSNGVKLDVTDYVKQCDNGGKFSASVKFTCYYWGGESVAKVNVFFENEKGEKVTIASGPMSMDEIENNTAVVSGAVNYTYGSSERVYLCITQPSGYHSYKEISLSGYKTPGDDPGPTQDPSKETITLFEHNSSSAWGSYSLYDKENTAGNIENYGSSMGVTYGNDWNSNNGVKLDVTDYLAQCGKGGKFGISFDITNYAWGTENVNKATAFFETESGEKTVLASGPDSLDAVSENKATISGSAEYAVTGEKTYLCITHPSGYHSYGNIKLTCTLDSAEKPTPTPAPTDKPNTEPEKPAEFKITAPVLDENGAGGCITVANTTEEDKSFNIYTASYNENGSLKALHITPAAAAAGEADKRITFEAAAGDTVYVWDTNMEPLTPKTVLTETAWVAGWGSATQQYSDNDLPGTPLSGSVIREIIRMSTGGDYMKLTLSNYYGSGDLVIDSVRLADYIDGSKVDLQTEKKVTFNGSESVTIPKGEAVESDVICYSTDDLEKLAVTIKASKVPAKVTGHSGARTTTYINTSAKAAVSDEEMTGAETNEHWYFVSAIDVLADKDYSVIACLGDSITDGRGCTTNANNRWTDVLMERIKASGMKYSVVNDGIGGNSINSWGLGEAGIYRFRNEVINRKGLKYIIVLEGINDIGKKTEDVYNGPSDLRAEDGKITTGIINAYQEIIDTAHSKGIKVIGGTILPCGNSDYCNETSEAMRQTLNSWIRGEGHFDAVIDFDAVMCDPEDKTKMKAEYDSGDGLHPGPAGYKAMGEAIELSLFE